MPCSRQVFQQTHAVYKRRLSTAYPDLVIAVRHLKGCLQLALSRVLLAQAACTFRHLQKGQVMLLVIQERTHTGFVHELSRTQE